jgi:predicted  nucleic acid-binding Zn-ribbon protein
MPNCIKCGHNYNSKRAALGYKTCLNCGSPPIKLPIVPVNKSNYVVGTLNELRESYSHKGTKML